MDNKENFNQSIGENPNKVRQLVLSWGSYPLIMSAGAVFLALMVEPVAQIPVDRQWLLPLFGSELTIHVQTAFRYGMYLLPILVCALWVFNMERIQPFSKAWKPTFKHHVVSDIGLFIMNNVILRAEFFVALAMAGCANIVNDWVGIKLWPGHWPILLQVLLFMLLAEFFTYWLHRLQHEQFWLWRIHCVHHNPDRLYWLNATRFHYFDVIAIPLLSNAPAVAIGADTNVIYMATTLSVMHGMWQHCNAEVRFGWLNYLVSSPELHRWHHLKDTAHANHNYGSNLIVWDLVFGTWYLPKERPDAKEIGVSGLKGDGIFGQLLLPFTLKKHD